MKSHTIIQGHIITSPANLRGIFFAPFFTPIPNNEKGLFILALSNINLYNRRKNTSNFVNTIVDTVAKKV